MDADRGRRGKSHYKLLSRQGLWLLRDWWREVHLKEGLSLGGLSGWSGWCWSAPASWGIMEEDQGIGGGCHSGEGRYSWSGTVP